MTSDEQRAACIEAMAIAMFDCYRGYNEETQKMMWLMAKSDLELKAKRAFDALHGLARICPVEATEEMIMHAGLCSNTSPQNIYRVMSAAGDLTNGPEGKA